MPVLVYKEINMKIALATPVFPVSIDDAVNKSKKFINEAAEANADIICFPESYVPGMRGTEYHVEEHDPIKLEKALEEIRKTAEEKNINVIIPMDWDHNGQILNVAFVISRKGEVLGFQSKNQLDPAEDAIFIAGNERHVFEIDGEIIGIAICHEGLRYPESVRWSTVRGAKIIFHPFFAGSDTDETELEEWGSVRNPYYEKAMMCRALENTVFFASINYAFLYPEAATSIISPTGDCLNYMPYGKEGVLIQEIDLSKASRKLAKRYRTQDYNYNQNFEIV